MLCLIKYLDGILAFEPFKCMSFRVWTALFWLLNICLIPFGDYDIDDFWLAAMM